MVKEYEWDQELREFLGEIEFREYCKIGSLMRGDLDAFITAQVDSACSRIEREYERDYDDAFDEGHEEGYKMGREEAYDEGYEDGYEAAKEALK